MGRLAILAEWRGARQGAPSFVMGWAVGVGVAIVISLVVGGDGGRR